VVLLIYSKFNPTCFGKWLPSSGGYRCPRNYSSNVCVVSAYGLQSVQPHWTVRNTYTPKTQTLLEKHLSHLRHPEDGNHLPKHFGVNLEHFNKSTSFLTHLLAILQRYYKMLGPNIKTSTIVLNFTRHVMVVSYRHFRKLMTPIIKSQTVQ
jgi:hypothetical protein